MHRKIQTLTNTADVAFQNQKELSFTQFARELEKSTTKSFPTVKRMIKNMLELEIVNKTEEGKYIPVASLPSGE